MNKIKNYFKSNEGKSVLWTILLTFLMVIPLAILFIHFMFNFSKITWQFWFIIYVYILVFIVLFSFVLVIYEKLKANYDGVKHEKIHYKKIFLNELLGNFSICFLMVTTIIYIDQLSKHLAETKLLYSKAVHIIPKLIDFRLVYNPGAAWSILSNHTNLLAIISLIASFVILFFLKDFNMKKNKIYSFALTFILGGTVGNMIDRFINSKGVVDFIEFAFMDFPTFNVADSFLVVGTILLAIYVLFDTFKESSKSKEKEKAVEESIISQENTND